MKGGTVTPGARLRRALTAFGFGILFGMVADLFAGAPVARLTGLDADAASWAVILGVAALCAIVGAVVPFVRPAPPADDARPPGRRP